MNRMLVSTGGAFLLLVGGIFLYTRFLSGTSLEGNVTEGVAEKEIERQETSLREMYSTVVQVRDYVFVPDAIAVHPNEEIAFFTSDSRAYDIIMKDKKLFTVQGLADDTEIRVSTFLFRNESVYSLDIADSDNTQKHGTLTVTVQP